MATPGWYPDPGRSPGMLRYYDGTSWTGHLRPAPTSPPAVHPGAPHRPGSPGAMSPTTAPGAMSPTPAPGAPGSAGDRAAGRLRAVRLPQPAWLPVPAPLAAAAVAVVVVVVLALVALSGGGPSGGGPDDRTRAIDALRAASPSLTDTQLACIVDTLAGQGVDPAELASLRTPTAEQTAQRSKVVVGCTGTPPP